MSFATVPNNIERNHSIQKFSNQEELNRSVCDDYLNRVKKQRERKEKAVEKALSILDSIDFEYIRKSRSIKMNEWKRQYPNYRQMIKLADVSQLEFIFSKMKRSNTPLGTFINEIKEL